MITQNERIVHILKSDTSAWGEEGRVCELANDIRRKSGGGGHAVAVGPGKKCWVGGYRGKTYTYGHGGMYIWCLHTREGVLWLLFPISRWSERFREFYIIPWEVVKEIKNFADIIYKWSRGRGMSNPLNQREKSALFFSLRFLRRFLLRRRSAARDSIGLDRRGRGGERPLTHFPSPLFFYHMPPQKKSNKDCRFRGW